jgi:hypothetical protein
MSEIMDVLAYAKPGPYKKAGTALFFGGSTPDILRLSSAIAFVLIYFPVCYLLVIPSTSPSDELLSSFSSLVISLLLRFLETIVPLFPAGLPAYPRL